LYQDNAPANNDLSVKEFLAKNRTPALRYSTYSSDLISCDFWLLSKSKSALKGTHSESVDTVKTKSKDVLKALKENGFPLLFQS